ncbi:hypothetical protein FISHEDRAFT_13948, partial [Fistulina hepatica ATCC 64428]
TMQDIGSHIHTFPHISEQEKTDVKRTKGQISCAECRRLKLKCDRKIPCSTCSRRNCASICPTGEPYIVRYNRPGKAEDIRLLRKIDAMSARIRQLEDAIAIYHNGNSHECHPLLAPQLLNIKSVSGPGVNLDSPSQGREPATAFGTLTIGERGESMYHGPSAGAEVCPVFGSDSQHSHNYFQVSRSIATLSNSFPFYSGTQWVTEASLDLVYQHLPDGSRASTLVETFSQQAFNGFVPLSREELVAAIIKPVYQAYQERCKPEPGYEALDVVTPHKLASMFFSFSLGALVDLTIPPDSDEADMYYHLGRACMSLSSVFDSSEYDTVQALVLMALCHAHGGRRFGIQGTWTILSLACKIAQGVNRESPRWHLDARILQRRRTLFWSLFSLDLYFSSSLGRPPSIQLKYVDCLLPKPGDNGFMHPWCWEFFRTIYSQVMDLTMSSEEVEYQTVLELDRRIRESMPPAEFSQHYTGDSSERTDKMPSQYSQARFANQLRAITLLHLHKLYFTQALLRDSHDPLSSPYSPSFLASYRCASALIRLSMQHATQFPELYFRFWMVWSNVFLSAIVVGSVVLWAPKSMMAPMAYADFEVALSLFQQGARDSRRARAAMAIVSRMKVKIDEVYLSAEGNQTLDPKVDAHELEVLAGHTKVVVSKTLSRKHRRPKQRSSSFSSRSSDQSIPCSPSYPADDRRESCERPPVTP